MDLLDVDPPADPLMVDRLAVDPLGDPPRGDRAPREVEGVVAEYFSLNSCPISASPAEN